MKFQSTVSIPRNLDVDGQIFQTSRMPNNIVETNAGSGVLNRVNLDFDFGNYQYIDLSTSTENVTINITNQHIGLFALTLKQHSTTKRSITLVHDTFTYAMNGFSMIDTDLAQEVSIIIFFDGSVGHIYIDNMNLNEFVETKPYTAGYPVLYDNDGTGVRVFAARTNIPAGSFDLTNFIPLSAVNAKHLTYTDPLGVHTTVESALIALLSSARFISVAYPNIAAMLVGNNSHATNAAYLVQDVTGTRTDPRIASGFAIYLKSSRTSGSIFDYDIVAGGSLASTEIAFSNTFVGIQNDPTNVQDAIANLKSEINNLISGLSFINKWDASTNTPFLGSNAKYDNGQQNTTVTAVTDNVITITNTNIDASAIASGVNLKVNNTTYRIDANTTTNSTSQITLVNLDGTAATGLAFGNSVITANATTTSGAFFISTSSQAGSITNDLSDIDNKDRIISNGSVWLAFPDVTSVIAEQVDYNNADGTWSTTNPTNVKEALDILSSRSAGTALNKATFSIDNSVSVTGSILEVEALTGLNTGMTRFVLQHNLNKAVTELLFDVYFLDTSGLNQIESVDLDFIGSSRRMGADVNNECEVIMDTPTTTQTYTIVIRTEA